LWRQRVRQGQHGYRFDSLGFADYFLGLLIGVSKPQPALLAFTEARKYTDTDWNAKGIAMRRSFDAGRSWDTTVQIQTDPPQAYNLTHEWTDGPYNGEGYDGMLLGSVTYENATGTVFIHYSQCFNPCVEYGCQRPPECGPDYTSRLFYIASSDLFDSWTTPVEITHMLPFRSFSPGPGEGAQAKSGRLIICGFTIDCFPGQARHCTGDPEHCNDNCQGSVLILSDDRGKSWFGGARLPDLTSAVTNECDATVLSNGSLLVGFRGGPPYRFQARSDDEGESFAAGSARQVHELPSPGVQASLITAPDGTLFLSHPFDPKSRVNMTVAVSRNSGDSWQVQQQIYPGPSGYGSITMMPPEFGEDSLVVLYNRGADGDGCYGSACPYSTVVSVAVVPLSNDALLAVPAAETIRLGTTDAPTAIQSGQQHDGVIVADSELLLSLGGWCSRESRPDTPGIFDNHKMIVFDLWPAPCVGHADCMTAINASRLIFGAMRCSATNMTVCPVSLKNGSLLSSGYALAQFGRQHFGMNKFVFAEKLGPAWDTVIADAACYAQQQHAGSAAVVTDACGMLMIKYARSLCGALHAARLQWYILDGSGYAKEDLARPSYTGLGTAQMLHYLRQTCKNMTVGWSMRGGTGQASYIFQNFSTYSVDSAGRSVQSRVPMTAFVDYFLPRTWGNPPAPSYFSNNGAMYSGECSQGLDERIMEWTQWSRYGHIPLAKLLAGIGSEHTAYHSCPPSFLPGKELQPCMPSAACNLMADPISDPAIQRSAISGWLSADRQGDVYDAVQTGHMGHFYDVWSQQSYFLGRTSGDCLYEGTAGCLNFVDSDTAQSFDFRLRHLHLRGVSGYFTQCADLDFAYASWGGDALHWNQPTGVVRRFQASAPFSLTVGDASAAAGGLDMSSADSFCRMFGARIASLAVTGVGGAVHCIGDHLPNRSTAVWPLQHITSADNARTHQQAIANNKNKLNITVAFQLTTKSAANISSTPGPLDPVRLATDPSYRREPPITSDAGRIVARLLGGAVATHAQVLAAASGGAVWPCLGLTIDERHGEGLAENELFGTRADGDSNAVVHNTLRVYDGGLRALAAVNIVGPAPDDTTVAKVNSDPENPFFVTARTRVKPDDVIRPRLDMHSVKTDDPLNLMFPANSRVSCESRQPLAPHMKLDDGGARTTRRSWAALAALAAAALTAPSVSDGKVVAVWSDIEALHGGRRPLDPRGPSLADTARTALFVELITNATAIANAGGLSRGLPLPLPLHTVIDCHWLSFSRDLHSSLAPNC
jgi:hypothetical protein